MEERAPLLSFSALLKQYRRAAGLTQAALAERAGYSTIYISKLEEGERRPLPLTVTGLAAALDLSEPERSALEAAARRHLPAPPAGRGSEAGVPGSGLLPLVGRVPEQELLTRHLSGVGPPVLLLAGEPGIGKSRLLLEASQRAADLGWRVLEGGCQRRSGQEPYAPVVTALGEYVRRASKARLRRTLHECAWPVRLLPELAESVLDPTSLPNLPPEQERRLIFAAVGRFLANMAGPAGTLLVLDDLQWAGGDALDLLTLLARSSASTPLRVLGAYRSTEVRPPDPLGQTLADLAAGGLAAQQRLGPLTQEEASTLLQCLLAGEQDPGRARREQVLARTGGVPFFLVSCAEALRSGTLASEEEAVPWTVAQSIRQRVAALSAETQDLLGVAAVIRRQMERSVLVRASTRTAQDEGALVGALEEVGQAHLLVETDEDPYQFPHDLIREVVLADLSALRRRHAHAQIAAALEQAPGEPPVEQLAEHYRQTDDHEKAILYLEQVGDRAASLYANAEAQGTYRALLARLQALGRPLDEARVAEKLAKILRIQAHYEQALEAFQQAADAYERGGGQEGYWRVVTEIGWSYHRRGRHAEGLSLLRPLVMAAEQSAPPRQLVAVLTLLAAHERNTG